MEAKSFLFSVGKGSSELRVVKKMKDFAGGSPFGLVMHCVAAVDGGSGVVKSWG